MNSSATSPTVNLSTQPPKQPQQRQTAKEIITANVKSLIEQLEAGHSDALTAYLDAMSRFHNYSFGNILEIARQRPSASRVAGMYAWNQIGRRVKEGASPSCPVNRRRKPSPRWCMNWRTRCCTRPSGAPPQRKLCGRQRPRPSPL